RLVFQREVHQPFLGEVVGVGGHQAATLRHFFQVFLSHCSTAHNESSRYLCKRSRSHWSICALMTWLSVHRFHCAQNDQSRKTSPISTRRRDRSQSLVGSLCNSAMRPSARRSRRQSSRLMFCITST